MALDIRSVVANLSQKESVSASKSLNQLTTQMGEGLKLNSSVNNRASLAVGDGGLRAPENTTGGLINMTDQSGSTAVGDRSNAMTAVGSGTANASLASSKVDDKTMIAQAQDTGNAQLKAMQDRANQAATNMLSTANSPPPPILNLLQPK